MKETAQLFELQLEQAKVEAGDIFSAYFLIGTGFGIIPFIATVFQFPKGSNSINRGCDL